MATSGLYNFSINRNKIVRQSLLNIGKIGRYDNIDSDLMQDCVLVLNMICKQMQGNTDFAPGFKVWTRERGHLFLSTSTGIYEAGPNSATGWTNDYVYPTLAVAAAGGAVTATLSSVASIIATSKIGFCLDTGDLFWATVSNVNTGTKVVTFTPALPSNVSAGAQVFSYQTGAQEILALESAVLRDQDLSDFPLTIMRTTQDYDNLPSKRQPTFLQDPTAVYHETRLGGFSKIYIDAGAAQDVTKHIVLTYMQPVQDFLNPTDEPYYPQEYYLSLCWGLSKFICPQMNRVWTQTHEDSYQSAMSIGRHKDPELTTLFFQPGVE